MATDQADEDVDALEVGPDCAEKKEKSNWDPCMCAQVCEMVKAYNDSNHPKKKLDESPSKVGSPGRDAYEKSIADFGKEFAAVVVKHKDNLDHAEVKSKFYSPPAGKPPPPKADCQHEKWKDAGGKADPVRSGDGAMNPDHMHPASLNGPLTSANLKWADSRVNYTVGGAMGKIDPAPKKMKAQKSCNCP
jgi:hypothetical protein